MLVDTSTPLIRPEGPNGMEWPVYLRDAMRAFPNTSFSDEQQEENLVDFGYFPLHQGTVPVGDVVTPATPKLIDGKWTRQYDVRAYTVEERASMLAEARQECLKRLDAVLYNTYARGFTYEHPTGETHVYSLSSDNQQLLTGIHLLAKEETNPDRIFTLRTQDELMVQYGPAEVVDLTKALMEYVMAVLAKLWELRDDVALADTIEELPTVPDYITL